MPCSGPRSRGPPRPAGADFPARTQPSVPSCGVAQPFCPDLRYDLLRYGTELGVLAGQPRLQRLPALFFLKGVRDIARQTTRTDPLPDPVEQARWQGDGDLRVLGGHSLILLAVGLGVKRRSAGPRLTLSHPSFEA